MIVFYTLLMIVNPDPELLLHHRISGLCYVISFTIFVLLFRKFHNDFRKIDYSLPSSEMFAKAAERYKLTLKRYLVVVLPLLLIDAGITISEYYRWTSIEPINRILLVQAFYIPILLISGFIGYLIWRKRQKPLRDGALQILNDLNEVWYQYKLVSVKATGHGLPWLFLLFSVIRSPGHARSNHF